MLLEVVGGFARCLRLRALGVTVVNRKRHKSTVALCSGQVVDAASHHVVHISCVQSVAVKFERKPSRRGGFVQTEP